MKSAASAEPATRPLGTIGASEYVRQNYYQSDCLVVWCLTGSAEKASAKPDGAGFSGVKFQPG
jgi:hypothetical protein